MSTLVFPSTSSSKYSLNAPQHSSPPLSHYLRRKEPCLLCRLVLVCTAHFAYLSICNHSCSRSLKALEVSLLARPADCPAGLACCCCTYLLHRNRLQPSGENHLECHLC